MERSGVQPSFLIRSLSGHSAAVVSRGGANHNGHMTLRSDFEFFRGQSGDLDCTFVLPAKGKSPRFCVVLCHGFGAPGTDLVPISHELSELAPELSGQVAYLFPEAPLELGGYGFGGRAWWMIDIERFQRAAVNPVEIAAMSAEIPVGMPEASQLLCGCLESAAERTGVPLARTLVGGFSQGSMVATDVVLRLPEPPAGLCVFSGHLLAEHEWRPLAQNRGPLPVLQTHGKYDPLLPIAGAIALRDMLVEAGIPVEFVAFNGPHTISIEGINHCAALMQRVFKAEASRGDK
jgi:phospholipase/carboxylesterase